MDDVERALDDGVNAFKSLTKEQRFLPGGGATEIELARLIAKFGDTCSGIHFCEGGCHSFSFCCCWLIVLFLFLPPPSLFCCFSCSLSFFSSFCFQPTLPREI